MKPITVTKFKGLRNIDDLERFDAGDLGEAINIDLTDTGKLVMRSGYESKVSATAPHSLWGIGPTCLFIESGALKLVNPDYTTKTLRTGLASHRMSYAQINGRVYYGNGVQTGAVDNGQSRSWGFDVPVQPSAAVTVGLLPPGTYQYALTFIRQDGQESGTGKAGAIELTGTSGIAFSNIASHAEAITKRLYVSTANGEELYHALTLTASDTTASHQSNESLGMRCTTQFCYPPPAGNIVFWYNGRMYVASGNTLYPSKPYQYELFELDKTYLPFNSRITICAPVADGIWIGTDTQTIFLSGPGPESFQLILKASHGAIPGTLDYGSGQYLGDGSQGMIAYWASPNGICAGGDGGSFQNLTEKRYRFDGTALAGAGSVRQYNGMNQYLLSMQS